MKSKKIALFVGLITSTMFVAGCSSPQQNNINDTLKDSINAFGADQYVSEYRIIGAETEDDNINIYGLSKFQDGNVAYTDATYYIPDVEINALTLSAIENIVSNHSIQSLSMHKVSNNISLNDAIDFHTEVTEGFYKQSAVLLSISSPQINDLKNIATFTTKTYVKSFEIPKNISSSFKLDEITKYQNFVVTNKITLRLNSSEIESIKENPSKVYDMFVDYVNKHQTDLYNIEEKNVDKNINMYLPQTEIDGPEELQR